MPVGAVGLMVAVAVALGLEVSVALGELEAGPVELGGSAMIELGGDLVCRGPSAVGGLSLSFRGGRVGAEVGPVAAPDGPVVAKGPLETVRTAPGLGLVPSGFGEAITIRTADSVALVSATSAVATSGPFAGRVLSSRVLAPTTATAVDAMSTTTATAPSATPACRRRLARAACRTTSALSCGNAAASAASLRPLIRRELRSPGTWSVMQPYLS
ncbi:MAG: hypothetical protein ACRCYU_05515 [Nocardioides sp.]